MCFYWKHSKCPIIELLAVLSITGTLLCCRAQGVITPIQPLAFVFTSMFFSHRSTVTITFGDEESPQGLTLGPKQGHKEEGKSSIHLAGPRPWSLRLGKGS